MCNGNAGSEVGIEKQLFDRNRIRFEQLQKPAHIVIDQVKAAGQTLVRRRGDNAALYQLLAVFFRIYDAEADRSYTRINA